MNTLEFVEVEKVKHESRVADFDASVSIVENTEEAAPQAPLEGHPDNLDACIALMIISTECHTNTVHFWARLPRRLRTTRVVNSSVCYCCDIPISTNELQRTIFVTLIE